MLYFQIIVLVLLLILSGFFSGVETAFMTISRFKLKTLVKQKKKGAESLRRLKENPQRLIITILIGNNLVNIGAASLATLVLFNIFGNSGVSIATGVMTFLILVFGEITPKTIATYKAVPISLTVAPIISVFQIIIFPLVWFFEKISKVTSGIFSKGSKEDPLSEDELRTIVSVGKEEGVLSHEAADMMHNLLEFEGTIVTEIMTPKTDVEMISGSEKLRDVLDFVIKKKFSRYPVYLKNKDNIIGFLDVDDVLLAAKNRKLSSKVSKFVQKVMFVPESKNIDELLTEIEKNKKGMAIVVDEYSGVSGIVTVEDILEEIVGDIFDKSKKNTDMISKVKDKIFKVSGRTPLDDLNKDLQLGLDEETHNFNTIAGYIEHVLQKIPKRGEKIEFKKATIVVDSVTPQGVKSVRIFKK